MKPRVGGSVVAMALGLSLLGMLRQWTVSGGGPPLLAGFVTPSYVGLTVVFGLRLQRAGVPLKRWGFGLGLDRRQLLLAILATVLLLALDLALDPALEALVGRPRDLARFSSVQGSTPALAKLLALNWTVAAFGEELAYRIVLMGGIAFALASAPRSGVLAVLLQAVVFGLAHLYQGPVGVLSSFLSGLVLGAVTLRARGSVWPAALAHGGSNTVGILTLWAS